MALPLKYSARNILRRKARSVLTVLGIALVVLAVVCSLAFVRGLRANMRTSGDPDNVVVLSSKAGTSVWFSEVEKRHLPALESLDQVRSRPSAADPDVEVPLVTPEVHFMMQVEAAPGRVVIVRGVDPKTAFLLNSSARLTEGSGPHPSYSLIVGPLVAAKLGLPPERLAIGQKLRFKEAEWTISGTFSAPGTMMESEIWCHVDNLNTQFDRTSYALLKLKATGPEAVPALCAAINDNRRYQDLRAFPEVVFYEGYAATYNRFTGMAIVTALVIAVAGVFSGVNTMSTAVRGRIREIGTLQVLGFSRRDVVLAVLCESLLLAGAGGVIGCAAGLLLNGVTLNVTWFAFALSVDAWVLAIGFSTALLVGLVGALLPAWYAVRMRMVDALRSG